MTGMRSRAADDSGATLLFIALMMTVFLGISAFAVDLGMAYAVKRQLSSTSDATSLAGAQEGAMKFEATGGCPGNVPTPQLVAAINAAVAQTHNDNAPWGSTGVPSATITCTDEEITVTVDEASNLGTFFAPILGISTLSPSATATANVFGAEIQAGLRPFTICVDDTRSADAETVEPKSTRESFYINHNSATPTETSVGSGTWAAFNDTITVGGNHNLEIGDWVEVVDNDDGSYSGFYYVRSIPTASSVTVSGSITYTGVGPVVDVTAAIPVPVDLYKVTEGLVTSDAIWDKGDDTLTLPGHSLSVGDPLRVVVTAGAGPAISALYDVETIAGNKVTLMDDAGTPVDVIDNGKADVYEWINSGPSSSACAVSATAAPGNWGYARFDLGGDQPTLECLVEFGYGGGPDCDYGSPTGIDLGDDDPTTPEVTSDGNTGNSIGATGSWTDLLDDLVDETILLPVAEIWNQNGSNAQYTAKGGAAVEFCGYMIPKNNNTALPPKAKTTGTCWDPTIYTAAVGDWPEDVSLYIQWRYVEEYVGTYVGQGDGASDLCAIDDSTCIPVLRLIK